MPRKKYKQVPRQLSQGDKIYIKLVNEGMARAKAFRQAYPDHPSVIKYVDAVKNSYSAEYRKRYNVLVVQSAKEKLQTKHIQSALVTYQNKMDAIADDSLEVLHDILLNGRSEKVRADIGMEMVRHKVGSPVAKVQVQQETNVYLTFGEKPVEREDSSRKIIDL